MGTNWRGLLAPVNLVTDDGRRFKSFTNRALPLALKWQRIDASGHDDSVTVGSLANVNIGTTQQAIDGGWISPDQGARSKLPPDAAGVWGAGELFDDIDTAAMPRLAQDVAEAKELLVRGVVAPSVDPIPVGNIWIVEPGSDEPISMERMDQLWFEAMENGQVEPKLEILFEEGLIAAATLVMTPAFSEVRPFELIEAQAAEDGAEVKTAAALVAAVSTTVALPPAAAFDDPGFDQYTEITVTPLGNGWSRVAGHFAPLGACHLEFRNVCVTPPLSAAGYVPFHRYPLEVVDEHADGVQLLGVGRLTAGYGRVGTGCNCCRGKDDHACNAFGLADTIRHYDRLTTLAWVRAGEDAHGLWVSGVVAEGVTAEQLTIMNARKFSGDWREVGGELELVEVLALAQGQPGFPAPRSIMREGRQFSLVAAFRPSLPLAKGGVVPSSLGVMTGEGVSQRFARAVADLVVDDLKPLLTQRPAAAEEQPAAVTAAAQAHTGAMVALRMTDADAERLAVEGGEPADELHLTLAYLGEAADIPPEVQASIVESLRALVGDAQSNHGVGYSIAAESNEVTAFNPGDQNERDTALVLGFSGDALAQTHQAVMTALGHVGLAIPEQFSPWKPHVTLIYSDDVALLEQLTDRTGPVTFDRLRVAFAGEVTDIPLAAADPAEQPEPDAATLMAEINGAGFALEAAELMAEIEGAAARV